MATSATTTMQPVATIPYWRRRVDAPIKLSDIVFLDIEASGLGDNCFPIEVGFVAAHDLAGWSILIRPPSAWLKGKCWDARAEDLHRLSLEEIQRDGWPVLDVAAALNQALAGKLVFCDEPDFDRHWLGMVYKAAALTPGFALRDSKPLFLNGSPLVTIDTPILSAMPAGLRRHRARDDACRLAGSLRILLGASA